MNRIYAYILAFGMACTMAVAPAKATPIEPASMEVASNDVHEIGLVVKGNSVRITNASGLTLSVYYLTGAKAASFAIDSDDKTISTGLAKGVYLFKVGKVVRKVSVS